jgi:hypothetical protein
MKISKLKWLGILVVVLSLPTAAHADVIWPALYLEAKMLSVPVIASGLLLEALMLRFGFAKGWKDASKGSFVVNLISTIAGILLIPLAGIAWEVFPGLVLYKGLNMGTFNPVTWIATFSLALGITTSIEIVCLKRWFSVPTGKRTWALWTLINAVTVGLAFTSLAIQPVAV